MSSLTSSVPLNENGINVSEKRFDEPMTRAEGMALIDKAIQVIIKTKLKN